MKITYHHRTRGTGAEGVHITTILSAFKELGYKVSMLSFPGADPDINKAESPNNVKLKGGFSPLKSLANITKKLPQFIFELFEVAYNCVAFPRLHKEVKANEIDFIYERYSLFMFAGVLYAKLSKKKIVLEVNDSALVERVRPLKFKWLAKVIEEWTLTKADGVVFISTYFKELCEKNYPALVNTCVSPNAANLEHFKPTPEAKAEAKRQLKLEEKTVIGYVGAFVSWHGIDWFVKEIIPFIKERDDLVLLLVGDGVEFDKINKCITDNDLHDQIILTGRVAHTEVSKYLSAMDVGILPDSNHYGSPMKLFEFMAMEIGMICPNFQPIDEVVVNNQTGWLFKANDHVDCINKTLEITKQKDTLELVGKQARKYIENQRQWIHNAEMAIGLLDKDTSNLEVTNQC